MQTRCSSQTSGTTPDLSVVIPCYGRGEQLARLQRELGRQSLDADRFEVLAVDDGSPEPIRVGAAEYPYAFQLLRQANAGPGAARNRALQHCRAPLVLILNDDAVLAWDLLEKHLAIHEEAPPKTAVMGSFRFTEAALRSPFVRILQQSSLLFDFPNLRHGALHDWRFFWTCNISLPREALLEVGGFDAERFREAIVEDVELGYRLHLRGWRVLYREDARCQHDHAITPEAYSKRMVRLGVNTAKMWEKHRDPVVLYLPRPELVEESLKRRQLQYEALRTSHEQLLEKLQRLEQGYRDKPLPDSVAQKVCALIQTLNAVPFFRGIAMELTGSDPDRVVTTGPATGVLTSVILVSHDALEKTRRCLEALRSAADEDHPAEILVVDNGSSDGSAEYLAAQPDVTLIQNPTNVGAPRARNQAIPRARGEWIVFLDNDVVVSPGWLRRLRYHAEVDPRTGCVCPVSDRAAHGQQVPYEGGDTLEAIAAFAHARAAEFDRCARYTTIFSSLCVLVRRSVIERIGGFDERFSPWGFEDDDFSLRVRLAGYRSRIAFDVFVRHESYGGARNARHKQLLRRNWKRFARKWGSRRIPHYGEYGFLDSVFSREWSECDLRIPLPAATGAAAAAGS